MLQMLHVKPVPPVTACDEHWLCFTSDVITHDQNSHHLCSSSAESFHYDIQIRGIESIEPEIPIFMKILRNLSYKLRGKFS